jgi:hypothetical protein
VLERGSDCGQRHDLPGNIYTGVALSRIMFRTIVRVRPCKKASILTQRKTENHRAPQRKSATFNYRVLQILALSVTVGEELIAIQRQRSSLWPSVVLGFVSVLKSCARVSEHDRLWGAPA